MGSGGPGRGPGDGGRGAVTIGRSSEVRVSLATDLAPAVFLERPNRFLVRARAQGGKVVDCHLPDPGRLRELLFPGAELRLESARNPERRTRWTVRLVRSPGGDGWVSVDTGLPNRLLEQGLRAGALDEFRGWRFVRKEVPLGNSRFDFLLEGPEGRELYLEAKSVTLVEEGVALFPDAVTARGARHVRELSEMARNGTETAVLFILQRPDAWKIRAARWIDPDFADALAEASKAGVRILGRRCHVSESAVTLGDRIPADVG
jgi:sugar fermentation stimulation protein A